MVEEEEEEEESERVSRGGGKNLLLHLIQPRARFLLGLIHDLGWRKRRKAELLLLQSRR